MKRQPAVRETEWPEIRNALLAFFWQSRPHVMRGTTEVDVTDSLAAIRRIEKELRIAVSFHAFAVYCVVQAAMQHPIMHTYRYGKKLLTFEDIDLLSPIDKRLPGGVRIPVGHILRSAQNKTLAEINWEIRQAVRASDLARRRGSTGPPEVGWVPLLGAADLGLAMQTQSVFVKADERHHAGHEFADPWRQQSDVRSRRHRAYHFPGNR